MDDCGRDGSAACVAFTHGYETKADLHLISLHPTRRNLALAMSWQ